MATIVTSFIRIMNIGVRTRSLVLLLIATIMGVCEEAPNQQKITFPKWAFCVAYQVRDADVRETRPVDPKSEKDPFNDGANWIPHSLINVRNIVDVAALSTRIAKSGVLKHQAAEGVIRSTTEGNERHPIMDCYDPHHLFVFYGYEGNQVAAIEVCFSCNRVKMIPEVRDRGGVIGPFETADLAGLAKIATEAGLDLKPFASLEAYVQRLASLKKPIKEEAGQGGALPSVETQSNVHDKRKPESKVRSR